MVEERHLVSHWETLKELLQPLDFLCWACTFAHDPCTAFSTCHNIILHTDSLLVKCQLHSRTSIRPWPWYPSVRLSCVPDSTIRPSCILSSLIRQCHSWQYHHTAHHKIISASITPLERWFAITNVVRPSVNVAKACWSCWSGNLCIKLSVSAWLLMTIASYVTYLSTGSFPSSIITIAGSFRKALAMAILC